MKIGFIATRSGLISEKEQISHLKAFGVDDEHIYTAEHTLDEAIKACDRGMDMLVVHSAVIIGKHAYPRTIKALAAQGALLHIMRKDLTIDCVAGEGVADGLMDISHHNQELGKVSGRKKKLTPEQAQQVSDWVKEPNPQNKAPERFTKLFGKPINTTDVSRACSGYYNKVEVIK